MDYSKLSDDQLQDLGKKYGSATLLYRQKFAGILPEINKRKLYLDQGMYSIYEYASRVGGLSNDSVNRVLKIAENLKELPLLMSKLTDGACGWSKLEVVSKVAKPESEKLWVKRLETMSYGALRACVKANFGAEEVDKIDPYEKFTVKIRKRTLTEFRVYKKRLEKNNKHPVTWDETINQLLIKTSVKPHVPGRNIPRLEQRKIEEQFKGVCAFPNCNKPADVIHHPERYALTKSHNNLKPLCKIHHEIAHHGLIKNEEGDPGTWSIILRSETDQAKHRIDQKFLDQRAKSLSVYPTSYS